MKYTKTKKYNLLCYEEEKTNKNKNKKKYRGYIQKISGKYNHRYKDMNIKGNAERVVVNDKLI